jgi:hypothetical protein
VTVFLYDGGLAPTRRDHHRRPRQRDGPDDRDPRERADQPAGDARLFRAIIANNRAGGWRKLKNDR